MPALGAAALHRGCISVRSTSKHCSEQGRNAHSGTALHSGLCSLMEHQRSQPFWSSGCCLSMRQRQTKRTGHFRRPLGATMAPSCSCVNKQGDLHPMLMVYTPCKQSGCNHMMRLCSHWLTCKHWPTGSHWPTCNHMMRLLFTPADNARATLWVRHGGAEQHAAPHNTQPHRSHAYLATLRDPTGAA